MTAKEIAIQTIQGLPENVSWEDIQERINFIAGIRKGLREIEEGKGIPHEKIREEWRNGFPANYDEKTAGHRNQGFPPRISHEEQIRLLNLMPDEYVDDASSELTGIVAESRVNTEFPGL